VCSDHSDHGVRDPRAVRKPSSPPSSTDVASGLRPPGGAARAINDMSRKSATSIPLPPSTDVASDPAVEQQAVARVHRIGQTRPVVVTRLYCDNTVEAHALEVGGPPEGWRVAAAAAGRDGPVVAGGCRVPPPVSTCPLHTDDGPLPSLRPV